eukprot:jgi/Bigna1/134871/aug1.27_g9579
MFAFTVEIAPATQVDSTGIQQLINSTLDEGDLQRFSVLVTGLAQDLNNGGRTSTETRSLAERRAIRADLLNSIKSLQAIPSSSSSFEEDVGLPSSLLSVVTNPAFSNSSDSSVGHGSSADSGVQAELDSHSRAVAIDIATNLVNNPANTFVSSMVSSTLSAVSNIIDVAAVDADAQERAALAPRVESVLTGLAQGQTSDAVTGEFARTVSTKRVSLASHLVGASQFQSEGTTLVLSNATLRIPGNASSAGTPIGNPQHPLSALMVTVNDDTVYPPEAATATSLVVIELRQLGQRLPVQNLSQPVVIQTPKGNKAEHGDESAFTSACRFWNPTVANWSSAGVRLRGDTGSAVLCESNHLTAFNARTDVRIQVNTVDERGISDRNAYTVENPVMWFGCSMAVTCLLFFLGALFYDKLLKNSDQAAKDSRAFWRKFNRMRLLRAKGKRSWSNFLKHSCWDLRRMHPWLFMFRHRGDFLTSAKRSTVFAVVQFLQMVVSALIHRQDQELPFVASALASGLVSCLLAFPVPYLHSRLFSRKVPKPFYVSLSTDFSHKMCGCLLLCTAYLTGDSGTCCGECGFEAGDMEHEDEEWVDEEGGNHQDDEVEEEKEAQQGANFQASVQKMTAASRTSLETQLPQVYDKLGVKSSKAIMHSLKSGHAVNAQALSGRRASMRSFSDDDIDTHRWNCRDYVGVAFAVVVVMGSLVLLIPLSWQMRDCYEQWVEGTLLSFCWDFILRVFQILMLEMLIFAPFVPSCFCHCSYCFDPKESNDGVDGRGGSGVGLSSIGKYTESLSFETGGVGFYYRNATVTYVEKGGQAEQLGVKRGWTIMKIEETDVSDDTEVARALRQAHRTLKVFEVTFSASTNLLSRANVPISLHSLSSSSDAQATRGGGAIDDLFVGASRPSAHLDSIPEQAGFGIDSSSRISMEQIELSHPLNRHERKLPTEEQETKRRKWVNIAV